MGKQDCMGCIGLSETHTCDHDEVEAAMAEKYSCRKCAELEAQNKALWKDHWEGEELIDQLEAKLDRVRGLPEKWREDEDACAAWEQWRSGEHCADELQSALGDEDDATLPTA